MYLLRGDKYYAGTAAAIIHSSVGNVAAGPLFATAQSAGAGGYGLMQVSRAVQACGGAMAVGGGGIASLKSKLWRVQGRTNARRFH